MSENQAAYFSLMGMIMYFLLNMSNFAVHLRTLSYPSSPLWRTLIRVESSSKGHHALLLVQLLIKKRTEYMDLLRKF